MEAEPSKSTFPERIGRYRILRLLGEGGMGSVFEAEQENPRRTVALKVVSAGILTEEMRRRFELEGQVLGHLHHPCIAQIYEAGMYESGNGVQPYFAMERIAGRPLLEYADENALGTRERLALVARICDGIQHAHQRGVIHRDLKPANILVDEEGQPKILDFGLARTTDSDIQASTLHTDAGRIMGTIPYMSPEQAAGDPSAVEARSDIYSLGVVSYQLVSGAMPYAVDHPVALEALRIVRDEDARPLSSINRSLRGDVETIIGKALEKEPERRYASAADLAADLRRYLDDEPITARPPSALYQLKKFARRNRGLVTGIVAVFLALVVGLLGTARGFVKAQAAAARAEETADFLREILGGVDPGVAQGADTTVLQHILEQTDERIEAQLSDHPMIEATIRSTMVDVYFAIADFQKGLEHAQRAHELFLQEHGPRHPETLRQQRVVGTLKASVGDLDGGVEILRRALDSTAEVLGPDHLDTHTVRVELGIRLLAQQQRDDAAELFETALAARERALGPEDEQTLVALNCLGLTRLHQGRTAEAERLLRRVLEVRQRNNGESHPETVKAVYNLGAALDQLGREEEAEALLRGAIEDYRRILGPDHYTTLQGQQTLAVALLDRGRLEEALELQTGVVQACRARYGSEDLRTLMGEERLARVYRALRRPEDAVELARHAYEGLLELHGEGHTEALRAMHGLHEVLHRLGEEEEALALAERLPVLFARHFGETHSSTLGVLHDIAVQHVNRGDLDVAEPMLRAVLDAIPTSQRHLAPAQRSVLSLAVIYHRQGRPAEALTLQGEFLDNWTRLRGDADPLSVSCAQGMVDSLARLDETSPFEAEIRSLLSFHERTLPAGAAPIALDQLYLAEALIADARPAEAAEVLEASMASPGTGEVPVRTLVAYAAALTGIGELEAAEELLIEAWEREPGPRVALGLAQVCDRADRPDEAEAWREMAAD